MKEINLTLPAQAAKMGGDLGAILGQHGVNIVKFCKEFNAISNKFEYNLPVKTYLVLEDSSNFKINVIGPVTSFLIKSFGNNKKEISLLNVYKIILIKKEIQKNLSSKILLKNIKSTINSMRYIITYE